MTGVMGRLRLTADLTLASLRGLGLRRLGVVVLFGDRAGHADVQDPTFGRHFDAGPGLDWLIDIRAPLRVDVLPPT